MSVSEESSSSLIALDPLPDLTGSIVKLNDQYSEAGSFSNVYRCKHHSSSGTKEVAVKAFRFNFTVKEHSGNGRGTSVKMVRRELGIWRRLDHKNIVPFLGIAYGFGRIGTASLVSLWMPNGTLHDLLAKYDARLTTARRLQLLLDIANGLLYLHSFQIIHGDLNCNNVLLDENDNARLTDFGYASLLGEIPEALAYLQMSTRGPRTLRWAAPEQISLNPEEAPQRTTGSDIYSFGNIALQVFSGKVPWSEVRGDVAIILLLHLGQKPSRPQSRPMDDQYWEFIGRCWSNVQERPSAKDIVPALQYFLTSLPLPQSLGDSLGLSAQLTHSQPTSHFSQTYVSHSFTSSSPQDVPGGFVPIVGAALEPVAPLGVSANRWVAPNTARNPIAAYANSPELVDRKVRSLLDKLTMEKFDTISDQIIAWANKSENEKDGRTLIQVIRLVFEKAIDEAAWNDKYARLCRKMMETISPEVQDDGIRNTDGKPIAGGQLFRKYLLNRCQEEFERGWFAKEMTAAMAAAKASDDQAIKAANDKQGEESELYSEEYFAAQKARRQGLGLIKFIGELFKLQMLTERIMHECVKKLLGNVETPEEEEIESLCQLLKTVGLQLDVPKARAHMDVYFARMKELCKSLNVSPRMQFMLQDVIELRERRWVARGAVRAPTTIAAIHEAAAKEKAAAEARNYQRQISMSRGGSRRGGDRNAESGPDGWTAAGSAVPRPPPKSGDLSKFGRISKGAPMVMGPGSVFAGKKDTKRDSLSRTNSSSNLFSMLSQNPELATDAIAKASRPPSRRPSAAFGQTGLPELPMLQRKKLQLLPRGGPPPASKEEPEAPAHVSEADIKRQINEDVNEFFAVRNLEEADVYFTKLAEEHRFRLVDKLVAPALEGKEGDALLVGGFFAQAASKGQCSPSTFEAGFMPMAEFLDDIAIDAPNAFKYMAIMLKGAGFDKDEARLGRIAGKSLDSDELLQLVSSY